MIFGGFEKITLIDYPGKLACMAYTIGCNFRCPYCHNPELVDETVSRTFSEVEILDFLERRRGVLDGIVITGGEPTLHGEDLMSFMKKAKEKGFLVKLDSNGTNPEFLKKAISLKIVDYIAMDIKSPMHKYSRTVARPVNTEAIKKSIKILMSSPVDYEFRTTLIKAMVSPQDIEEIGRDIEGAKKYYLQKFIPTKLLNPQFKRKTTYEDSELKVFQKKLRKYIQYVGIR